MANIYEKSLHRVAEILKEQGFSEIDTVCAGILATGGYKNI